MMASNLMFALQACVGASYPLFHATILIENVSGGMGTTAFVAYLASLCNVRYTAVQYALLTSFMQISASSWWCRQRLPGRRAGLDQLLRAVDAAGLPALALLWWLGRHVHAPRAGRRAGRMIRQPWRPRRKAPSFRRADERVQRSEVAMRIGVPKEIKTHEYRVGLTPASVRELVDHGHEVIVEAGAGDAIGLVDALTRRPAPRSRPTPRRCSRAPS